MNELKTLKDISEVSLMINDRVLLETDLKQLAIKWIKKDILEMPVTPQTVWLLNRWKKRLNITEEDFDLKQEEIKDYKRYYKELDEAPWGSPLYNALIGKLEYIKWKNNLTEKDLK